MSDDKIIDNLEGGNVEPFDDQYAIEVSEAYKNAETREEQYKAAEALRRLRQELFTGQYEKITVDRLYTLRYESCFDAFNNMHLLIPEPHLGVKGGLKEILDQIDQNHPQSEYFHSQYVEAKTMGVVFGARLREVRQAVGECLPIEDFYHHALESILEKGKESEEYRSAEFMIQLYKRMRRGGYSHEALYK